MAKRHMAKHGAAVGLICGLLAASPLMAATYPAPVEGDWTTTAFRFHTGETLPELRLHYRTIGAASGEPVLVLHGTTQTGAAMLTPAFADELFGPGQPLDAQTHYIILPDSIGVGGSSKPSDGLRAHFPHYDYADAVEAQYRLVTDGLKIKHLRLVLGNSMGGMQAWLWAQTHPDIADAFVPMAAQPTAMASRNWIMRRLLVETIRHDPDYKGGDYTAQPPALKWANAMFGVATAGGTLRYQQIAPTRAAADAFVDSRMAAPFNADANDYVWQWDSSADYDAARELGRISAPLLAINSADDERNPPQSGLMDAAMKQVPHGTLLLIPESADTSGHLTTSFAKFYAKELGAWLKMVPRSATQ